MTRARVVTFGLRARRGLHGGRHPHDHRCSPASSPSFTLHAPQGSVPVELHLAGRHNLVNALGAAAAASAAGVGLAEIARGLAGMRPVPGRLQFKRAASGAWIIDDSYNANPSSVQAGIEVLAQLEGRRWLVFADMAELGDYADRESSSGRHVRPGPPASNDCSPPGRWRSWRWRAFGAGASWFPTPQRSPRA